MTSTPDLLHVNTEEEATLHFSAKSGAHISSLALQAYGYLWEHKELKAVQFSINGITVRMSR